MRVTGSGAGGSDSTDALLDADDVAVGRGKLRPGLLNPTLIAIEDRQR
jgi:hypothetical protein